MSEVSKMKPTDNGDDIFEALDFEETEPCEETKEELTEKQKKARADAERVLALYNEGKISKRDCEALLRILLRES